ncbi:MAG TPA: xanthine dehydrogenase family protein subunit M [Gemmatimonadales bacterium]|nr:xanthine dehydrogenase family protein subunit M [Gemmatimonadales bacterium]
MRAFEYASPKSTSQAIALLGRTWEDAQVLAGGTDLLSLMKDDVVAPKRLVNIKDVEELRGLRFDPRAGLRLGALVSLDELTEHAAVRQHYPGLHSAVREIGGPQIRNQATVGGNLCQRPRCWYYRSGFGLLAQQGGRSMVVDGDNRYHAILGNAGPAYFVSPSTVAPALISLGATVRLLGPGGAREMPLEKFFRVPRTSDEREHDLRSDEIVTEVRVPPAAGRSTTYEVREKEALDWPLVTASVALKMDGSKVQSARVVLGHAAPVPWRSAEAEAALTGKSVTEQVAAAAGDAAVAKAKALSGNAYKIQLARVAVKRAVLAAGGGAR